jgi:hypothetical protein
MEPSFSIDRFDMDVPRLCSALADPDSFRPQKRELKWFSTMSRFPSLLREVLLLELTHGNVFGSIQAGGDWPQVGSIMVFVDRPFFADHTLTRQGLSLGYPHDPHYWTCDIQQTVDGVYHAIAY